MCLLFSANKLCLLCRTCITWHSNVTAFTHFHHSYHLHHSIIIYSIIHISLAVVHNASSYIIVILIQSRLFLDKEFSLPLLFPLSRPCCQVSDVPCVNSDEFMSSLYLRLTTPHLNDSILFHSNLNGIQVLFIGLL